MQLHLWANTAQEIAGTFRLYRRQPLPEGPVIRPRSANTRQHMVTKLALHIRGRFAGVSLS